jgi:SNF2 family N-terminal domain.
MYGIAWMNSRLEYGGGIIGDWVGMGKTMQTLTWLAMRKEALGTTSSLIALVIVYVQYKLFG